MGKEDDGGADGDGDGDGDDVDDGGTWDTDVTEAEQQNQDGDDDGRMVKAVPSTMIASSSRVREKAQSFASLDKQLRITRVHMVHVLHCSSSGLLFSLSYVHL